MPAQIMFNIAMAKDIPGSTKAQWTNVGVIVKTDNGKLFGTINYLPVAGWNGKFCLFAPQSKADGTRGPGDYQEPLDQEPQL